MNPKLLAAILHIPFSLDGYGRDVNWNVGLRGLHDGTEFFGPSVILFVPENINYFAPFQIFVLGSASHIDLTSIQHERYLTGVGDEVLLAEQVHTSLKRIGRQKRKFLNGFIAAVYSKSQHDPQYVLSQRSAMFDSFFRRGRWRRFVLDVDEVAAFHVVLLWSSGEVHGLAVKLKFYGRASRYPDAFAIPFQKSVVE